MPQIFRIAGYLIYFWPNENKPLEPLHVHISTLRYRLPPVWSFVLVQNLTDAVHDDTDHNVFLFRPRFSYHDNKCNEGVVINQFFMICKENVVPIQKI